MTEQQATSGGAIGKLTGRAKELAGAVLGRDDLHREGMEREKADAASERRQVELEAGDLKQKAQRAEEAATLIEHKGKS